MARRGRRNRQREPDEYFAAGPIEVARFGRLTVGRSRGTPSHHEQVQARLADALPRIEAEIDALVDAIAARISRLPADRLLHRAWWELAATITIKGVHDAERAGLMRMVDYVQSIVASVAPASEQAAVVGEEDWAALQADIGTLFGTLSMQYQWARTSHARAEDPDLDIDVEEFRVRAETLWMHVRGKRYQDYERRALDELLGPHSDELEKLFGMDASTLVAEFDKILRKLTAGAGESLLALKRLHEDSIPLMEAMIESGEARTMEDIGRLLWADPVMAARRDAAMGEVFGTDLFDVGMNTGLPRALVDELTWGPGGDTEFFAPGPMRGWPLRVWPTMKRPFIRLGGKPLCFDLFGLFDNLYRVLQRVVFRLDPEYRTAWNERQKTVSEELPFRYLDRLLPGMREFKSVYYRFAPDGGKAQWHEADGVVAYDDHLIVIEVKGGAFTYTSPATDLPAHLASLRNLLLSPASQGSRFIDYLESAPEVTLADAEHREIGTLRRGDYRHVTVLAITLDPFTELAARAQHLKRVGVDVGARAVWSLSLDDLRVYADIFANPLVFLHYVEQRIRAAASKLVDLNDEFDHVGLYLKENDYARLADEVTGEATGRLTFDGFRSAIDDWQANRVRGKDPTPPRQQMPERIAEIVEFLARTSRFGRSRIVSFLLDAAGDQRQAVADGVETQLAGNRELGRLRPLSSMGEHSFTMCCWSPSVPRNRTQAADFTRAAAAAHGERSRLLLELEYDRDDRLVDAHWQDVGSAGLSTATLARIETDGRTLRRRRVEAAAASGRIPVNASCPCGSGRKFKLCCRP